MNTICNFKYKNKITKVIVEDVKYIEIESLKNVNIFTKLKKLLRKK